MANTTTTTNVTANQEVVQEQVKQDVMSALGGMTPEQQKQIMGAAAAIAEGQALGNDSAYFAGKVYSLNSNTPFMVINNHEYTTAQVLSGIEYAINLSENGLPTQPVKGWQSWKWWQKAAAIAVGLVGVGVISYAVNRYFFGGGSSGEVYVDANGDEFEIVDC